jgi:two-component system, cell cycle sensor histidine kinase and response regulator CckA
MSLDKEKAGTGNGTGGACLPFDGSLDYEDKYRALFSEMKSGCTLQQVVFDKNGAPADYYTIDMNPAAESLLGLRKQDVVGKPVGALLPPEEFKKWLSLFGKVATEGTTVLYEQYSPHNRKLFEGHAFCNKPGQFAVIFDDVTKRKKAEEAMQNFQKLESLGVLAGGIAHDFNNLLSGIFGYIDLAQSESGEKSVTGYLSKALSTLDRARGLTQQLLTFAKGGAPALETHRLPQFVRETSRFALSGSNVSCAFDIPDSLWPCNIDKNQIGQVIDNIVINAQQAMPLGGTIRISAANISFAENEHLPLKKGDYVRLSFSDSGVGIPKDLLPRIFDPFFTTKTKGHGLGLATCYSIVKRHEGAIEVESEPGIGATFHVYLPASPGSTIESAQSSGLPHKGSGTVLVMDDEDVIRNVVAGMLKKLGYSVECAADGTEALRLIAEREKSGDPFVALILDLTIPGGLGGRETLQELRNRGCRIPAFVASGYAEDPVMARPQDHGFTASICKPFRKSDLAELLEKHLRKN